MIEIYNPFPCKKCGKPKSSNQVRFWCDECMEKWYKSWIDDYLNKEYKFDKDNKE